MEHLSNLGELYFSSDECALEEDLDGENYWFGYGPGDRDSDGENYWFGHGPGDRDSDGENGEEKNRDEDGERNLGDKHQPKNKVQDSSDMEIDEEDEEDWEDCRNGNYYQGHFDFSRDSHNVDRLWFHDPNDQNVIMKTHADEHVDLYDQFAFE